MNEQPRSVVTGSSGFVGRHLVYALGERGDAVVAIDRQPGEHGEGVEVVQADILDADALAEAFAGARTVFHCASVVHTKHNRLETVRAVNVDGTKRVIEACRAAGVPKLVYVSSASVVYEGDDIINGDERLPYARTFHAPYAETKAIAERAVREANGPDLLTCAIRPHVVFGPGDARFIPAIVNRARAGKLKFTVGKGDKLSDFTYVTNLTDALLLADEKLAPGSEVAGEAYFVSNGEPTPFWDFVRRVLEPMGLPAPRYSIPYAVAYAAAWVRESFDTLRGGTLNNEEGLSRFAIRYICTHHYFDHAKATRELGYRPRVNIQEGIDLTIAALRRRGDAPEPSHAPA